MFVLGDLLWRFFMVQRSSGHLENLCRADGVGGVDHRRHRVFQPLLVDILLGRIIIPAARIVEIIPGADQVQAGSGGGTAQAPAQKAMIAAQAGIEIGQQRL